MELSSKILTSPIQLGNDILTWVLTKGSSPNLAKQNFINKRYPMPCRVPQKLDLYWFDTVCLHNHLREPRFNNGIKMTICFDLNLWQRFRNFNLDRTLIQSHCIPLTYKHSSGFIWARFNKREVIYGLKLYFIGICYDLYIWP